MSSRQGSRVSGIRTSANAASHRNDVARQSLKENEVAV